MPGSTPPPISPRAQDAPAPLSSRPPPTLEAVWACVADMHGAIARLEQAAVLRIQAAADDARAQLARDRDEGRLASLRRVDASAPTVPSLLPFPGGPATVSLRPDPETLDSLRAIASGMQRQPTPRDRWIERGLNLFERVLWVAALVLLERLIHAH